MAKMSDQEICDAGYALANQLFQKYVTGQSAERINDSVDMLRYCACSILGIDIANARVQLGHDKNAVQEMLEATAETIIEIADNFEARIHAKQTHFEQAKDVPNEH